MPKSQVAVQFIESMGESVKPSGRGTDTKFVRNCPRFNDRRGDYFPLSAQLADERFNQRGLNNLRSFV